MAQQSLHTCDENEDRSICVYIYTMNLGRKLTKKETLG